MSNVHLSKLISGLMTRNGRPSRKSWNIFIALYLLLIIAIWAHIATEILAFHVRSCAEYVYEGSDGAVILTDSAILPIEETSDLQGVLHPGDVICVYSSRISGEVIEIYKANELIYKADTHDIVAVVIGVAFSVGFGIFFLFVINKKNPGKRLRKIQREFIG